MYNSRPHYRNFFAGLSHGLSNTKPEWAAAFAQDPTGTKRILIPVRDREWERTGLLKQISYLDLAGFNEVEARKGLLAGVNRRAG